jgi:hypothetical protein
MANQMQLTTQEPPNPLSYRMTARIVGILFLAGMVVGIGGNVLIQPILNAPDHLASLFANSRVLAIGAMLIMLAGVWDAAHGVLMFPVLKQHSERIAIGYLGYRLIDAAFIGLWSLFILLQIPLGREYLNAGASDTFPLQALSAVSGQASLYAYQIAMLFLGVAGVMLCYTFYRARLVPRLLAVWGLVGYVIHFSVAGLELLGFNLGLTPLIPGMLWELFIGAWLIAKGFSAAPVLAERTPSATTRSMTSPKVDSASA